jgi:hypothetical protein
MPDFERIREIKRAAQGRLLALPGVHSVAIGAKIVAGQRTKEPAIVVFVTRKKGAAELPASEMIPAEIDGVKTDVVEEEMPHLLAGSLPDTTEYDVMEGGIQIQAGTGVTGLGTLGCIARTDEPQPRIVALTCQHVVALWSPAPSALKVYTSPDKHEVIIWGGNVPGARAQCSVDVQPTGGGAGVTVPSGPLITTNADTPVTIASKLAAAINAVANANLTLTAGTSDTTSGPAGKLTAVGGAGFNAQLNCKVDLVWATLASTKVVTFSGVPTPGFLVVIRIIIVPIPAGDFQYLDVLYPMVAADTLNSIAVNVAARINGLGNPGVTATGPAAGATNVTITSGPNAVAAMDEVGVYAPMVVDPAAKLKATVAGNVITLSGRVDGDNYGVYTNVNTGGAGPTYGFFHQPGKNADLSTIATTIAGNLTASHIPNLTATSAGAQITLTGSEEAECLVTSDTRVGQPVNSFGSSCSHCCNKQFGHIIDARLHMDTAVIQLEPGKKYKADIEGIGFVTGDHAVSDDEALNHYAVKKRGRTTGLTNATVDYLHADGNIGDKVFHRHYTDAMKVTGAGFSDHGDSGSAVLNSANEVVGILFGGATTTSLVTPIQSITADLDVIVETATQANDVKTVPKPVPVHAMSMLPEAAGANVAPNVAPDFDWDRLREVQEEITATAAGSDLLGTVRKHIPETQVLIRNNRRFAALWRRHGGPLIVQSILRMALSRDQKLPRTINGKPLLDCLKKIREALVRYASRELCDDLARYESTIERSLSLTYTELLATLQPAGTE